MGTILPPMFLTTPNKLRRTSVIARPHILLIFVDLFCRWYVLPLFKDYPPLRPLLMYGIMTNVSIWLPQGDSSTLPVAEPTLNK